MKIFLKLFYNVLLGAAALVIVNLVGQLFRFHIAFNIITASVVGILGVPGFVLLIIFKLMFAV